MKQLVEIALIPLFGLLSVTAPVSAHLFYLERRASPATEPARLLMDVRVGHAFQGDVLPRMDHHIDRFIVIGENGASTDLLGIDGHAPAGIAAEFSGDGLVLYESRGVAQRLWREQFVSYAKEEGVDHLLEARAPSANGLETETYHRCAKAVLGNQASSRSLAEQETGCTLELVVQPSSESTLTLRLLLRGKPLGLALVRLGFVDGNERTARTTENGLVSFRLAAELRQQKLLVSAVHLEPAPVAAESAWYSWWASLALPERSAPLADPQTERLKPGGHR